MKLKSTAEMDCSIAKTLDIVGEWWTLLIVRDLRRGIHRFDQLTASLGIARNVLTARLERLVENGIVETRLYQERPPRSEYHLTAKGKELSIVMFALREWGDRWMCADRPPSVSVTHTVCDNDLHVAVTCAHCGDVAVPEEERRITNTAERETVPA